MKLVAIITVELDSASNRVFALIRTIPSVVNAVWWVAEWVYCKSYLDGSNYKCHKSQRGACHRIQSANEAADDDECFYSWAYIASVPGHCLVCRNNNIVMILFNINL